MSYLENSMMAGHVNYFRCFLWILLLAATASAAPPSYIWQVRGLRASDSPVDPSQPGATPALHQIAFSVSDENQNLTFSCSGSWVNADFPRSLTSCPLVQGSSQSGFALDYAVVDYTSAATGFQINLTESVDVATWGPT